MSHPRTDQRARPVKRRITVGLAVVIAVLALALGVVAGYVARGGPPDPVLVTTQQDLTVVTTPEPPAP